MPDATIGPSPCPGQTRREISAALNLDALNLNLNLDLCTVAPPRQASGDMEV